MGGYVGFSVFKGAELTSVRRLREGGPGSGPRPHGGSQKKSGMKPGFISGKDFVKKFPASTKVIEDMISDNMGVPDTSIPGTWRGGMGTKVQALAAAAEKTCAKLSAKEIEDIASGEQGDQDRVISKYGKGGKAVDALLRYTFDKLPGGGDD